jgi:hypothetical protein
LLIQINNQQSRNQQFHNQLPYDAADAEAFLGKEGAMTLQSLPVISRNPTQLSYLSPVDRNAGNKNETSPFHHWAGNDMDVRGGTYRRNDVLLDGTPLEAGPKVAYTPPMDAVAEFMEETNWEQLVRAMARVLKPV